MRASDRILRLRCLLWLVAGLAWPALAESALGQTGPGLLARWKLKPAYNSTYDVRRRETRWWQKLAVDRAGGLADLTSSIEIMAREDATRNDYRESDNKIVTGFTRASGLGTLSLDGESHKHWTEDSRSLTVINEDHLTFGNLVPLYSPEQGTVTLAFSGGWIQEKEIKERRLGLTTTRDQTWAAGWQGDATLGANLEMAPALTFSSLVVWEGAIQESNSDHTEVEADTSFTYTDHSRSLVVTEEAKWERHDFFIVDCKADYATSYTQYYQAAKEGQETKRHNRRGVQLNLSGDVRKRFAYVLGLSRDSRRFEYLLESSDKLDSSEGASLNAEYLPALPLLSGGTLRGLVETRNRRSVRQNTGAFDTREKTLEGEFVRPFGERLTVNMRTTATLTQDFYDDHSLDKDRLRTNTSVSARYTPSEAYQASAGYAAGRTEEVNIPRARTAQNQVQDDYRITADYLAHLPAQIEITQNFQISAAYTYYVFDEAKNTLTRTNRLTSKIGLGLWPHSKMRLEHIFLKSDAGAYAYSTGRRSRAYAKGSRSLRQYLLASLEYQLSSLINTKVTQSFDVEDRQTLSSQTASRREKRTLALQVALHKQLAGGFTMDASFERTSSNTEDDFWTITSSVEKSFD